MNCKSFQMKTQHISGSMMHFSSYHDPSFMPVQTESADTVFLFFPVSIKRTSLSRAVE